MVQEQYYSQYVSPLVSVLFQSFLVTLEHLHPRSSCDQGHVYISDQGEISPVPCKVNNQERFRAKCTCI